MSNQRKIVVALDPSSEETSYTIDWIIDNFLRPERDNVHLISALCLNSDFDTTELGTFYLSSMLFNNINFTFNFNVFTLK